MDKYLSIQLRVYSLYEILDLYLKSEKNDLLFGLKELSKVKFSKIKNDIKILNDELKINIKTDYMINKMLLKKLSNLGHILNRFELILFNKLKMYDLLKIKIENLK